MSRRAGVSMAALAAIALVVLACAGPIPLPFQAQATPGAAAPAKDGAPAKPGVKPGAGAAPGVPVVTTPATTGRIGQVAAFSGSIAPTQQTNLVPKTAGRIEKILVEVGDSVKAGQPLVQLDRGTLDTAVKQAEANVMSAQARLNTVLGGARKEDVEVARAQLEAARARLRAMEGGGRAEDVVSAQAAAQSAQARLKQVQEGAREADRRAADQAFQAAQAALNRALADYNRLSNPAPDELAAARAQADKTRAILQQAQAAYDRIGWRPDSAGRPEALALQTATADYENAAAQLRLREGPRAEDVAASERAVDAARAQLESTRARLAQLDAGPTAEELQIATATLVQAQQTLAKARQPFSEQDIEAQRQAVAQAEQQLALRSQPFTDNDVLTARAQLAQAQAALESARVNALEGTVTAPYDGVIVSRPLSEGSLASAQTPAIVIAAQALEVLLNVEESRIGQLKVGQPATLSLSSYPGKLFPARVSAIAPTADSRTHTFAARIRPEPAAELRAGMAADVRIVTEEKNDAVLVPRDALVQRGGKTVIFVVEDGRARQVEVPIGLSDEKSIEIPVGVKAGDAVVIAGQATVNDGDAVRTGAGGVGGAAGRGPGAPGKPEPGAPGAAPASGKPEGAGDRAAEKPEGAAAKPDGASGAPARSGEGGRPGGRKPEGAATAVSKP